MLKAVNRALTAIQKHFQGIPGPAAHLYRLLASRMLEESHRLVAEEAAGFARGSPEGPRDPSLT